MRHIIIVILFVLMLALSGCLESPTGYVVMTGDAEDVMSVTDVQLLKRGYLEDIDNLRIPVDNLSSSLSRYVYAAGGVKIKFFAVLDSEGYVKVAYDHCNEDGSHVEQELYHVVCVDSGTLFEIDSLGKRNWGEGQFPVHLSHEIVGDYVVISKEDLLAKADMFAAE